MKPALLAVLVLASVALAAADGDWQGFPRKRSLQKRDSSANFNDYLDRLLNQSAVFLVENDLEPYKLDDKVAYNLTFKLGTNWRTRLGLYNGEVQGLVSLERDGDAVLIYTSGSRSLSVNATVIFPQLVVSYNYAEQVLNLGPRGTVKATLKNLSANLKLDVALLSAKVTLQEFKLKTAKSIKVDVTGLTFLGNLIVESFANFFTLILKGPILKAVESQVTDVISSAVQSTSVDVSGFSS